MSKNYYYGIYHGRKIGVFGDWEKVKPLVSGYSNPIYKKFKTFDEAEYFAKFGKCLERIEKEPVTPWNLDDIIIFTDGSWSSKTKKSAIGIAFSGPMSPYNYSEQLPDNTTNQLAELYAIGKALEILEKQIKKVHPITTVEIWTDSDYALKCVTVWAPIWIKNNWTTSSGKPVKYRNYIESIYFLLLKSKNIKLRHIKELGIKSHQSKPTDLLARFVWKGNKDADTLARSLTI